VYCKIYIGKIRCFFWDCFKTAEHKVKLFVKVTYYVISSL